MSGLASPLGKATKGDGFNTTHGTAFPDANKDEDVSPVRIGGPRVEREKSSIADQSNSDVHSSRKSHRSRRFRIRRGNESSSKMDSVSMNSGFMSRNTKKRSIRRDGRGG